MKIRDNGNELEISWRNHAYGRVRIFDLKKVNRLLLEMMLALDIDEC